MTKAMLYDSSKCMACRGCQIACKQWWELPAESTMNRGTYENPPDLSAETWNKIRFEEMGHNGTVNWLFTRQACMHCTEAVCVWVCPTFARGHDGLGYVTVDHDRCIGCGRCVVFCPFEVPKLGRHDVSPRIKVEVGPPKAVSYKCVFCKDRVQNGLTTACAKTCPTGALQFGERADLIKQGRARVDALKATYPNANLYGEKELGGLHVMYVLTEEPGDHSLPERPRARTYPEFSENMFPDWYVQAIAEGRLPAFPPEARPEWYMQPDLVPATVAKTAAFSTARASPGMSWLGLGVVGGGATLWWLFERRMKLEEKEKQESRED